MRLHGIVRVVFTYVIFLGAAGTGLPRQVSSVAFAQFPPLPGQGGAAPIGAAGNVGIGGPDQVGGAAGGGSMADFSSLMTLVQQTIEPDSWEALGGVGTMAPYPQGVIVDPRGLLRDYDPATKPRQSNAAAVTRALAPPPAVRDLANHDWRDPAKIRCVSMRRMMQALAARQIYPERSNELDAFAAMAGLSRVTLAIVTQDDLILAGPVGGFDEVNGWQIDRLSGLPPMTLVSLAVGLNSARRGRPFGCTIDPTSEGLQAAAALTQQIVNGAVPMGSSADELAAALGRQNIQVFGTAPSHEVAYLMVEADRHMKQLALGTEPMPDRVHNYLQMIATTGNGAPPTDLLLRLWFTSQPLDVRATELDGTRIVQLAGVPIRLSGDNERAQLDGARGHQVIDDVSVAFVDHFNQNWSSIRSMYPVYGSLQSLYQATAIAELWRRLAASSDHETIQRAVMYFAADQAEKLTPPALVDSIAIYHRYRIGRKQHQVLMASGGVEVAARELLPLKFGDYPGLKPYAKLHDTRPTDHWWWNGTLVD